MKPTLLLTTILLFFVNSVFSQEKGKGQKSIAIVSIDTKGLSLNNSSMGNLVRIELEKLQMFEVLDKYDASRVMKENNIVPEECFGKSQLVDVGEILNSDLMLTGSAETFGDKIIIIMRLIDVKERQISKTNVMEFNLEETNIQVMVRLAVRDLFGLPNDPNIVNMLVHHEVPLTSDKTILRLNGPRFGMQFATGEIKRRLEAPESQGGYNSVAYGSLFGYQHEIQYVSKGDFQALFEFIGTINSIETNHASVSLVVLNGLRWSGWEFGFGPVFRPAKFATGFYDNSGSWILVDDENTGEGYNVFKNLDSRGTTQLNAGLIIAAGKTFSIGYLNLPVNFYWSPPSRLNSNVFGIMLGFNVAKKPKARP